MIIKDVEYVNLHNFIIYEKISVNIITNEK